MFRRTRIAAKVFVLDTVYGEFARETLSLVLFVFGIIFLPFSRVKASGFLMRSHRNTVKRFRTECIESLMISRQLFIPEVVEKLISKPAISKEQVSPSWTIILSEKTPVSKGVLMLKFSDFFTHFRKMCDMFKVMRDFVVVLEPSHSGYCNPEILQFISESDDKVIVESSEPHDYNFIAKINTNLFPVEFGSSDWIDDREFFPMQLHKEFDCVMIAAWNPVKRHSVLFRTLKKMNDPGFRVALAGAPMGIELVDIKEMIAYFGVEGNVTIFENLSQPDVNILLNKSKFNLLLSLKEGSNKSIFEGFFADVPGVVLRNNLGVNKNYFNSHTGVLTSDRELGETLFWMREHYSSFRAREWAMMNIACRKTTAKLEQAIANALGEPIDSWQGRLAVTSNSGSGAGRQYYDDHKRLPPFQWDIYKRSG